MQGVYLVINDIFNQQTTSLKSKNLLLFDINETIYNGNILFDGTLEPLSKID